MNSFARAALPLIFSVLVLAACVSGKPKPETYVDSSGTVAVLEDDRESCVRACNTDYARCSDRGASMQSDRPADSKALFGVDASCKSDLRACLPRCKSR